MMESLTLFWSGLNVGTAAALRIALILAMAWLMMRLLHKATHLFRDRVAARVDDRETVKRIETLARVGRYLAAQVRQLAQVNR